MITEEDRKSAEEYAVIRSSLLDDREIASLIHAALVDAHLSGIEHERKRAEGLVEAVLHVISNLGHVVRCNKRDWSICEAGCEEALILEAALSQYRGER